MANNERELKKISKLAAKGKAAKIVPYLESEDTEVVKFAITALAPLEDEDARNSILRMLDDPRAEVRSATAKAMGTIGVEYSKTHLQHRYGEETDEQVKADILEAIQSINEKIH